MSTRLRIFMTGVGGQGTLTATTLLARAALSAGCDVTSGEIHGMAQRGGVVESTLLIGYKSPKIGHGESGNIALLGALCALGVLPFGREVVEATIRATMKPKVAEINLKALNLGAACPA